ncbi:enoyl-CoA hydratase/isomerase family protein [Psychrosphaera haliotis]|uniref:enoyl-CoA hydratase/isomerase family protein n=1 Tax=Psychrosphaera haliotis TaxID=555083 RepID=UPI002ED9FD48
MQQKVTSLKAFRALLIDKDNSPQWKFATIHEVPDTLVNSFFDEIWASESHPLKML